MRKLEIISLRARLSDRDRLLIEEFMGTGGYQGADWPSAYGRCSAAFVCGQHDYAGCFWHKMVSAAITLAFASLRRSPPPGISVLLHADGADQAKMVAAGLTWAQAAGATDEQLRQILEGMHVDPGQLQPGQPVAQQSVRTADGYILAYDVVAHVWCLRARSTRTEK